MARYELIAGKSAKFWEITLAGASFTVTFGRIGTNGQTKTKDFDSAADAQAEHDKLVRQKTKKGYSPVATAPSAPASAPAPSSAPASSAPSPSAPASSAPSAPAPSSAPASSAPSAPAPKSPSAPAPAPSSAHASSSASAPASSAPSAPAPTSPCAPAPSSAPAPALPEPGAVLWTDALRAKVHAFRAFPTPLPPLPTPAAAWSAVRARWKKRQGRELARPEGAELDRLQRAALERLGADNPPAPASPEVEAVTLVRARVGNRGWDDDPKAAEAVVDHWIASSGLGHAVEALLASLEFVVQHTYSKPLRLVIDRGFRVRTPPSGAWFHLRARLAEASDADWEAARAVAAGCVADGDAHTRVGAAYLFPEVDDWCDGPADKLPVLVWMSAPTPERLLEAVTVQGGRGLFDYYGDDQAAPATALARHGAAAVPALEAMLALATSADARRAVGELLAIVASAEAVEALVTRVDQKELVAAAGDAARSFPDLAAPALARVAASRSKAAGVATALLAAAARSAPEAVAATASQLTDAPRRALEAAVAKATRVVEEAPLAALPPVLASPPWTKKRKKAAKAVVLDLPPSDAPPELAWRDGERAAWEALRPTAYEPDVAVRYMIGNLRLPEIVGRLAHLVDPEREDPEAFAALRDHAVYRRTWCAPLVSAPLPFTRALLTTLTLDRFYDLDAALRVLTVDHGAAFFDVVLRYVTGSPANAVELLGPFRAPGAAPLAAHCYHHLKTARDAGETWLLRHPEAAAQGLIPAAVGRAGKPRDAAVAALRLVSEAGHRELVVDVAGRWSPEAADAVTAIVDFDPLDLYPSKLPKMPDFWTPDGFTRPLLRDGRALPVSAVEHLGTMLAFSKADAPYAGLDRVRAACTPESLAAFAWDLFGAWQIAGWPSKEAWAFRALGLFGDDECARRLAPLIRAWPGESAHARAVVGLDVLAGIGSDVALMHLNGVAQKLKFKGLKAKAQEKIAYIAEARGFTVDELADRLVPDLDLDERGALRLDFGPRHFTVGFDELLRPFVRDAEGKRLKNLPKPNRADDADKAAAATKAYKALKKDVRTLAKQQILRLERAMCSRRRWAPRVWETFLAGHPLLGHLVRRLVWGVYRDDAFVAAFRVAEDGTLSTADDELFTLPDGEVTIGVAHALDLPDDVAAAFGELLTDYEILQPFLQLGRDVHRLTDEELTQKTLRRFEGVTVPTGKVLGLESLGWSRGAPQDGGVSWWYERPVEGGLEAVLSIDPGIIAGSPMDLDPNQQLGTIRVVAADHGGWGRDDDARPLSVLHPVTASEILRDLLGLSA